ncbi:hypothetical protein [Gordonia sp. IITR100]|uniref:hypothetical protein n=1 Tax=Gordonia sp. IITR100 TaxID=1314686 RepID=UPI00111625F9|nr:hypothetical protein [Gordonia sp. IITR100]
MYGWWQSFEHFCFPHSSPVGTSVDLARVERHARENWQVTAKKPVIGSFEDGTWSLEYRIDASKLHRQSDSQRRKYDRAREDGSRGNLGPVPPASELSIRSVDLDLEGSSRPETERPRQETAAPAQKASHTLRPVESNVTEFFEVTTDRSTAERVRREADLQERYRQYLLARGHEVMRYEICSPSGAVLATDLHDLSDDDLIEVKSAVDRETLRLALGQILDYQRFVNPKRCTLLVPEMPPHEMIDLFTKLAIRVVWPTGGTFSTR